MITEAMHLVGALSAQESLWDVLEERRLGLVPLDTADMSRMRALMKKYADLPMDLADAALVRVAEREGLHTIFTIDQADFGAAGGVAGKALFTVCTAAGGFASFHEVFFGRPITEGPPDFCAPAGPLRGTRPT